jgi:uncharacterized protein (DUF433 family)
MNVSKSHAVLADATGEPLVRKTAGICGGDACIRNTRIMVWLLVSFKKGGLSEQELLNNYPSLTPADLAAAWEYYRQNPEEIDDGIRANTEASNRGETDDQES